MSNEIEKEIERMESLGMKPFSPLDRLLMMKGYDVAKQELEKLREENELLKANKLYHLGDFTGEEIAKHLTDVYDKVVI